MTAEFPFLLIQEEPMILAASIPGSWLLKHCTPSWRIEDPTAGFQRVVNEDRARAIAVAVLDQQRSFPNAIVLATDLKDVRVDQSLVQFNNSAKFLIIDGQHRLWSQKFSSYDAPFICVIHLGLPEKDMAELFLEINDNQKRVPSSLRWDLFRLTRPDDDPVGVRTADLVYDLASERESPLYQRIDMTGENPKISLKQGSVAPAIKALIANSRAPLADYGYDVQLKAIISFVAALKECDAEGWDAGESPFYSARVFRAALRLMGDLMQDTPAEKLGASHFYSSLAKIDLATLATDEIKASQGSAGIKAIYDTLHSQIFLDLE